MTPLESEIVLYLKEEFSPDLILLGGSRALGCERATSDWDLYLVGDYPIENDQVIRNFKGAHLDIALFPRTALKDRVLKIYYGPVRRLRPLLENERGEAAAIASATQNAYDKGPDLITTARVKELSERAARLLDKIEGYSTDTAVAQFHMTFLYQLLLPAWFEVRGMWSLPAHLAIPLIRSEDTDFATLLDAFCSGDFAERLKASRDMVERLLDHHSNKMA